MWESAIDLGPEHLLRMWSTGEIPTVLETLVMAEWCRTVARPILGCASDQRSALVFVAANAGAVTRWAEEPGEAGEPPSPRVTTVSLAAAEMRLIEAQTAGVLLATLVLMHALLAVAGAGAGVVLERLRRKSDPEVAGESSVVPWAEHWQ